MVHMVIVRVDFETIERGQVLNFTPKVLQNETFEFSISRLGPLKEATLFIIKVNNLGVIIVNLYFCQTSIYGIHYFK